MFTVKDFELKYEKYTDDELFEVYSSLDTYSNEAREAFNKVISKNGGLENLINRQAKREKIIQEVSRIQRETTKLSLENNDNSFLKKIIISDILSQEEVAQIIDGKSLEIEQERNDKSIKPRTILGSIIGGSIASLIGGVLWGLQMIYSKRIFVILFIGLVLLCYGIIKLATKQSKENKMVLISTVAAVLLALLIGQLLYEIIGYRG